MHYFQLVAIPVDCDKVLWQLFVLAWNALLPDGGGQMELDCIILCFWSKVAMKDAKLVFKETANVVRLRLICSRFLRNGGTNEV